MKSLFHLCSSPWTLSHTCNRKGEISNAKKVEEKVEYPTTLRGLPRFDEAIETVVLKLIGDTRKVQQTAEKQGSNAPSHVAVLDATAAGDRRSLNSENSGGGTRTPDTRIMIPLL